MKKFLLSFAMAFVAIFAASAAEITFDFVNNDYGMSRESGTSSYYNPDSCAITQGGVTITLTKGTGNGTRLWSDGLRFYKKAGPMTIASASGAISKVVITTKTATDTQYFETEGYSEGTWAGSAASIEFAVKEFTSSNIAVKTIVVTVDGESSKKEAGLAFDATTATAVIGSDFTAPVLTKATNATITWTSTNEEVATVNENGEVTLVAAGTTTIKAAAAENDEYYAGGAQYTLTVKNARPADEVYFGLEMDDNGWVYENEDVPESVGQVWQFSIYQNHGQLTGTAYKGGNNAAIAFAISPVIDLTNCTNVKAQFEHACKYNANLDMCRFIVREAETEEWTDLEVANWPAGVDNEFISSGLVDLKAYDGKKIQLGFKYASEDDGACTWRVRDLSVLKNQLTSVEAIEAAETDAPAVFYNLQGVRVANPSNGVFIMVKGSKSSKVRL